jgi:hypothetical protein
MALVKTSYHYCLKQLFLGLIHSMPPRPRAGKQSTILLHSPVFPTGGKRGTTPSHGWGKHWGKRSSFFSPGWGNGGDWLKEAKARSLPGKGASMTKRLLPLPDHPEPLLKIWSKMSHTGLTAIQSYRQVNGYYSITLLRSGRLSKGRGRGHWATDPPMKLTEMLQAL